MNLPKNLIFDVYIILAGMVAEAVFIYYGLI